MCLLVVAWQASDRYPFVLAANRDERHDRPAAAAAWWPDMPDVFGGRDLAARGTWLAVDRHGRFAAVTNVYDPGAPPTELSRGALVAEYLAHRDALDRYLDHVEPQRDRYRPFSLVLFDGARLGYYSNRGLRAHLERGIHALSNAPLGVEWPKTMTARHEMRAALEDDEPTDALFALLAARAPDVSDPAARYRSAVFIDGGAYGTRCSTVITVDAAGELSFTERSFDAAGGPSGEVQERFSIAGR